MGALRPPPKLKLSEWIEREVRLPPEVAAQPGPIRLFPPQREIADAMGDPAYERVTVLKSARVGYSTLLAGVIGSYVANDPATILALLPREEDARTLVVSNLDPTFAASPNLANCLAEHRSKNKRNRLLHRLFPGGWLKAVAATSEANLRSHNARVLIVDEVDAMEETKEGSPVDLAIVRTKTFDNRKIIIGSTPTNIGSSHVLSAWAESDQRVYEVRCVECDEFHEIRWPDIHWDKGKPDSAHWCCPGCGCTIDERHKGPMVAAGRWRITRPEVVGHAGFKFNALISPLRNASWPRLVTEWEQAQGRPDKLKAFVNTALGEGWREDGTELDEDALASRAEPFALEADTDEGLEGIPADVLAITVGVDVQRKDRLEATFIGWSEGGIAYVLGHRILWGAPVDDEVWAELDDLLKQRWKHPFGGTLGVEAAAVDSGDPATMERVYAFCRPKFARKIVAVKGDGGRKPAIEKTRGKANGGRLWIVGVDGLKTKLVSRLTRGNSVRFSASLPMSWYEQLASERLVTRRVAGRPWQKWERIPGRAAEALDCTVYAFAVRELININWSARAEQLQNASITEAPKARPRVVENPWLEGYSF